MPPIIIFPEGATTNMTSIIRFKRGAFATLRPVKPFVGRYASMTGIMPIHGDSINIVAVIILMLGSGYASYQLTEMPVFAPN
jgi:1-acyl-sn-glycerol-3-phosphate acyltransferase